MRKRCGVRSGVASVGTQPRRMSRKTLDGVEQARQSSATMRAPGSQSKSILFQLSSQDVIQKRVESTKEAKLIEAEPGRHRSKVEYPFPGRCADQMEASRSDSAGDDADQRVGG